MIMVDFIENKPESAVAFMNQVKLGHNEQDWLLLFPSNGSPEDVDIAENIFEKLTNLTFSSNVFVAFITNQSVGLFEVYRKAPQLSVTVQEVRHITFK